MLRITLEQNGEAIGKGSFGTVVKIGSEGRLVAKRVTWDADEVPMEYHALHKLRGQPNIVQLFHYQEEKDKKGEKVSAVFVFEKYDQSLLHFLSTAKDSEAAEGQEVSGQTLCIAQRRYFLHQMCYGVLMCHKKNIIHRDIKSDNMLIRRVEVGRYPSGDQFELVLADFGMAKDMDVPRGKKKQRASNVNSRVVGTEKYSPPELFYMKKPERSMAHDIWSLAMTIAELYIYDCVISSTPNGNPRPWAVAIAYHASGETEPDRAYEILKKMLLECHEEYDTEMERLEKEGREAVAENDAARAEEVLKEIKKHENSEWDNPRDLVPLLEAEKWLQIWTDAGRKYNLIYETILKCDGGAAAEMWRKMLAVEPRDRPTIEQVMATLFPQTKNA